MIDLLKFSHDRKAPFKKSCDALLGAIDAFAEQSELDDWYNHFEKFYLLPQASVKQQLKLWLEGSYDYKRSKFLDKLSPEKILHSMVKHIGFLSYVSYNSKKYKEIVNAHSLIVEWIETGTEICRFSKLINLFNKENVLIIAVNPIADVGYKILYRPKYKFYDRNEVTNTFLKEIKNGLRIYLNLSRKLKVNLIPIASHIINQYLNYYSIFKYNRAKFCIQERHYQTSAIKNHLFHKFGGLHSCSIQKNIHQMGRNGFYYDMDIFFSLGNKTADRVFEYGSRIKQVVPVGSLFMEYYWFNNKKSEKLLPKKYDIVYFGINVSMALYYMDSYSSFVNDYYETFRWLADISKKNPHLRIGIKHHLCNKIDKLEMEIFKDTAIERIDQKLNSYEVAFQSRCAVTFGSTMGYELIAHGLPTLFLDPGGKCALLPEPDASELLPYRVFVYQDFIDKLERLLSGQSFEGKELSDKNDLCKESSAVSERIFSWLSTNK